MSPLYGTVPLSKVYDIPVMIRQDLKFNVSGRLYIFFDIDIVPSKGLQGLRARHLEIFLQVFRGTAEPESPPAAAGRCLEHHRIPDLFCDRLCLIGGGDTVFDTRDHRDPCLLHHLPGHDLIPHLSDRLRGWAYECNPVLLTGPGKLRIFSEESIPRVYGISPPLLGKVNNPVDIQIPCYRTRTHKARLIRLFNVKRNRICLRMDGHRRDVEFLTCPDDP